MKRIITALMILFCMLSAVSCSENKPDKSKIPETTETVLKTEALTKTDVRGIDVSSFNGKINWKKVKSSGISFAIIRAGGRGYGAEGGIYADKYALYNLKNAENQKIDTGVYFFSQAASVKEAEEEAVFVKKTLNGRKINLPVAYDVEKIKGDTSRIDKVKYKDSVMYAKAFLNKITSLGYTPMVYIGEDSILKAEDFKEYKIWYADYGKIYDSKYDILQYSKTGKVDGISTQVDLDVIYK